MTELKAERLADSEGWVGGLRYVASSAARPGMHVASVVFIL
jgi:hypothetical protein